MIYTFWKECIPQRFYQHICKEKNVFYLYGKNVLQPKISEIITQFLKESDENYTELRHNSLEYKSIFQYVYSNVFPEIYCSTERRGFDPKSTFHIMFKTYKDKKTIKSLGKNPQNYESVRNQKNVYEQKLVKITILTRLKKNKLKTC